MDIKLPQLPFLTREMLSFGNRAMIELEVVFYSNQANPCYLVGLTREGLIKHTLNHTGDDSEDILTFRISDIPIMLNIFTDEVTIEPGEFFSSVYLKIDGERVAKLCSGYVTKQSGISYPITHDQSEVNNMGYHRRIHVADPAVGVEWYASVGTNKRWKFLYAVATFTTTALLAGRRVRLYLGSHDAVLGNSIECFSDINQGINTTRKYCFAPYGAMIDSEHFETILVPIPPNFILTDNGRIQTDVEASHAGDQWSDIHVVVEEFIED